MTLTDEQLREIEARCNAATEGPWCHDQLLHDLEIGGEHVQTAEQLTVWGSDEEAVICVVAGVESHDGPHLIRYTKQAWANADFIDNARTDLPAVLVDLKEALQQLAEWKAIVRAACAWRDSDVALRNKDEHNLVTVLAKAEKWFCQGCHWQGNAMQLDYDTENEDLKCPSCGAWASDMICTTPLGKVVES